MNTKSTTHHLCTNIAGLLRNMKGKKITFFEDENGVAITDKQVRKNIAELQSKGHKLIGSDDCEGFDPFGGGCPGHPHKNEK
ncbi:MAG: hypothetical protein KAU20_03840 [Nanoarchaeota archaeon]|nr:hypothetical protein [Nanoarchaeota archaeon]